MEQIRLILLLTLLCTGVDTEGVFFNKLTVYDVMHPPLSCEEKWYRGAEAMAAVFQFPHTNHTSYMGFESADGRSRVCVERTCAPATDYPTGAVWVTHASIRTTGPGPGMCQTVQSMGVCQF